MENTLQLLRVEVEPIKIDHVLKLFIPDEDVIEYLHMSKKSLYNYRKKGYLSQIPLPGRCYTYLPYLIQDLLELNQKKDFRRKE